MLERGFEDVLAYVAGNGDLDVKILFPLASRGEQDHSPMSSSHRIGLASMNCVIN